jgi:hypothetical protein
MEEDTDRVGSKSLRRKQRRDLAADLATQFTQQGRSIPELAAQTGRRPSLVRRLLAEAGVHANGPQFVGTDLADTVWIVRECYHTLGSVQAVVRATSLDRRVVRHLIDLSDESVTLLGDPDVVARMAGQYRQGATLQQIAGRTGYLYNQVRAILIAAGVTLRSPGGGSRRRSG